MFSKPLQIIPIILFTPLTSLNVVWAQETKAPKVNEQVLKAPSADCEKFPQALKDCAPKTCIMQNSLILTEDVTYHVSGSLDGKCIYSSLDKFTSIECKLDKESLPIMADAFSELLDRKNPTSEAYGNIMTHSCEVNALEQAD